VKIATFAKPETVSGNLETIHFNMKKQLIQLLIFLFLSMEGFSQYQFTITIDSACLRSNDSIVLDGTFGLYGDVKIAEYPFWIKDTLLKVLEYRKEQVLTFEPNFRKEQVLKLEPMQYTLRYTPDDSTQNEHSVTFYPQNETINLSCFFFNKSYSLALKSMENNDYIKLISRYNGMTNMETMIQIHSLIIVKKRGNYYALYQQSVTNEQGLRFGDIQLQPAKEKKIKIDKNYLKLTNEQIRTIEEFWNNMHIYWLDNDSSGSYIPSQTIIYDKNGHISFQSKKYISELLWNKLN
jgi:hypothetical protein